MSAQPTTQPEYRLSAMAPEPRIEVMTDRLATAVDYATMFRAEDDPAQVEACERAIRLANMLSAAILATRAATTTAPPF